MKNSNIQLHLLKKSRKPLFHKKFFCIFIHTPYIEHNAIDVMLFCKIFGSFNEFFSDTLSSIFFFNSNLIDVEPLLIITKGMFHLFNNLKGYVTCWLVILKADLDFPIFIFKKLPEKFSNFVM